jgi:hypothetical protein
MTFAVRNCVREGTVSARFAPPIFMSQKRGARGLPFRTEWSSRQSCARPGHAPFLSYKKTFSDSRGCSLFVSYVKQTEVSRKGAKAQRRRRKEQAALNSLACFLCATSAFAREFLDITQTLDELSFKVDDLL